MKTRFINARILKNNDREYEIVKGCLDVDGNRIAAITESPTGDNSGFDRVIDCENNLLIPGFKNCHTHSAMTFLRSLADDMPLQDWLFKQVFPREDKLSEDDIYWLTILGIMEYLTSGVTGIIDMYFFQHKIAQVAKDTGFRISQSVTINDFGPDPDVIEERYLKVVEAGELSKCFFGIHGEYTTGEEITQKMVSLAHKYKEPFFTHMLETKAELDGAKERRGKTPAVYLDEMDAFKYGGGGYHGVWFEDADIEVFKKRGLFVVTNPCSNVKLASGIADIRRFYDEGLNVAIGTDGPASNNALDFFREMYLTATLSKIKHMDAAVVSATDVFYSATNVGAHCMGVDDADELAEGKLADLVMIDMHQPNMQPENNIVKNLVYAGSKSNVALTMVNGKILYEKGTYNIGFDPEEIYAKANEIVRRIG